VESHSFEITRIVIEKIKSGKWAQGLESMLRRKTQDGRTPGDEAKRRGLLEIEKIYSNELDRIS
jgi:hypothetical protein